MSVQRRDVEETIRQLNPVLARALLRTNESPPHPRNEDGAGLM